MFVNVQLCALFFERLKMNLIDIKTKKQFRLFEVFLYPTNDINNMYSIHTGHVNLCMELFFFTSSSLHTTLLCSFVHSCQYYCKGNIHILFSSHKTVIIGMTSNLQQLKKKSSFLLFRDMKSKYIRLN